MKSFLRLSLITLFLCIFNRNGFGSPVKNVSQLLPREERQIVASSVEFLCTLQPDVLRVLESSILDQISKPNDDDKDKLINKILTENILSSAVSNCGKGAGSQTSAEKFGRQQEGSYVDNDTPVVAPSVTSTGTENILQNIFSGNLYGIIQTRVGGVRSPETVTSRVSDIVRTLFTNISSVRSAISSRFSYFSGSGSKNVSTSTASPPTKTRKNA